jgi:hypothetical protein
MTRRTVILDRAQREVIQNPWVFRDIGCRIESGMTRRTVILDRAQREVIQNPSA